MQNPVVRFAIGGERIIRMETFPLMQVHLHSALKPCFNGSDPEVGVVSPIRFFGFREGE